MGVVTQIMDDSQTISYARAQSAFTPKRFLPTEHGTYPFIAALAVIVMVVRCQLIIPVFNHTIDEPFHIGAAVGLYEAHKHIVDATHPPIAWLVARIPLRMDGVQVPRLRGTTTVLDFTGINEVA